MDHYNSQLVAGYSKNTPSLGLVVFMPDYFKIRATASKVNSVSAASNKVSKRRVVVLRNMTGLSDKGPAVSSRVMLVSRPDTGPIG